MGKGVGSPWVEGRSVQQIDLCAVGVCADRVVRLFPERKPNRDMSAELALALTASRLVQSLRIRCVHCAPFGGRAVLDQAPKGH